MIILSINNYFCKAPIYYKSKYNNMVYTIEGEDKSINIAIEHVAVIYQLPRVNLLVLDNGHKIEVTNTQRDEILVLMQ